MNFITAIPEHAINVHNMPRDQLIFASAEDERQLPSEPLPLEFLRGAPTDNKPRPQNIQGTNNRYVFSLKALFQDLKKNIYI